MKNRVLIVGLFLLALLVVSLITLYVMNRGVLVVVTNSGKRAMMNVHAAFGGRQVDLGDIPPGGSAQRRAVPHGDSDVQIFFDIGGAKQTVHLDVYVTGGLKGEVDVNLEDGHVKSSKENLTASPF